MEINSIKKLKLYIDCPGTQSEQAGKTSSCQGCPNQTICASGKAKEPDPGKSNMIFEYVFFKNYSYEIGKSDYLFNTFKQK